VVVEEMRLQQHSNSSTTSLERVKPRHKATSNN
jgi:hypothetical protein